MRFETLLDRHERGELSQYAPTDLVKHVETNAIVSVVEHRAGREKSWTIDELAKFGGIGGLGPVFVGSPSTIADILQEWVEETDVDGFNLAYAVTPESFEDVVGYVVPELQRRGAYPRSYRPGTLREKLFGDGPYLKAPHPAARYRDIEAVKRREAAERASAQAPHAHHTIPETVRNRPAFLHDFYGARRGTAEFETAKWLNGRTGSHDIEHFVRSQTEEGYIAEMRESGFLASVVIGRDTPAIRDDNDEIHALTSRHPELVGVGSVDPQRLGRGAVEEAERAVRKLGLKAINVEPGFGEPAIAFDDPLLLPVYEALQDWDAPVFLMTGPTTPNLSFNDPDAIGRVARKFSRLRIVVHHGAWPRVNEIIGVAFRYANVTLAPDMYIFQPGGSLSMSKPRTAPSRTR
jgi:predicted TIM-barrel fold metal-dependent hydrolase